VRRTVPVWALLLLPAIPVRAAGQQWSYEGSFSGTTGTYLFTAPTTRLVLNTGLSVRAGRFALRAVLPLWYQNTTLVSSSGAGNIPTGGPEGQGMVRDSGHARDRQGKGGAPAVVPALAAEPIPTPDRALTGYELRVADPLASATVRLVDGFRLSLSAGAAVKIPLADTATIGTGQWDFGGQVSATVRVGATWTVGLDGSYWRLGDLDSLDLKDPLMGSLSVGTLIGDSWGAIASVSAGTRYLTGFDPPVMVSASLSRLGRRGAWGLHLGAGLTETAPDLTIGANWWVRFGK
jgi:hypothetical protein